MPSGLHVVFECFNFALFSLLLANNNMWRFVSPFGLSQGLACSQVAVIIRISCDSFCLEHIGSSMLGFVGWFKSKRVREHIQGSSPFLHTDSWIPLSGSHSPSDQVICPGGISNRTQENGFHNKTENS